MKKIDEIVKALRCIATYQFTGSGCGDCPYRIKEHNECDTDQVVNDAADLLEKIQRNMEADINFLKRKEDEAKENAETEEEPALKGYYTGRADAFYTALILATKPQETLNAALKAGEQE